MPDEPMHRSLREAAAVEPLGNGRYQVNLSQYYTVVGRPNGGYMQCVMASAALAGAIAEGSPHQHATSITTNYVGAPTVGVGEVLVEVRRIGRGATFVHTELFEEGRLMTESLVTLGTLDPNAELRYSDTAPFDLPPLEDCMQHVAASEVNIGHCMDLRLDPACAGWWQGAIAEKAEIRGWLRLNDGEADWDAWSVLFASDALPPATFPIGSSGWVPTLQLSSYVRSVPASPWLKARQWCVVVEGGLVDERCELFDDRNRLVASSSQLAMVRFSTAR